MPTLHRRTHQRAARLAACLLAGAGVAAAASPALAHPALAATIKQQRPHVSKISLLYVASARTGSLRRQGKHLVLRLSGLDRRAVWFSDRPARRTGSFPSRGLAAAWRGFGFVASPPNAALVYTDPATRLTRTAILELRAPHALANGTAVVFTATVLDPKRALQGDLADRARGADRRPAAALTDPSLFIDDTSAPVVGGCVLQPYSYCANTSISNSDLAGLNLTGAGFTQTVMNSTNFTGANLNNAVFNQASGQSTNFSNANLSNTGWTMSLFITPNFTNANFFSASMATNRIEGANTNGTQNLDTVTGCAWPGLPFAGLANCW